MTSLSSSIVEYIDPDWRDHFGDVEEAYEFYQRYSRPEFRRAYYEVTGDEWDTND